MDERIIRSKLNLLRGRTVKQSWPIQGWQARSADFIAPDEYRNESEWQPLQLDAGWTAGKTLFLCAQAQRPAEAPEQDLYLDFEATAMEGLLRVNGAAYAGIDANHLRVVLPPGPDFSFEAEFICVLRSLSEPELRREKASIRGVRYVQVDRALESVYYDLMVAWDATHKIGNERRKQMVQAALEDALLVLDMTAPDEEFGQLAAQAQALLQRLLAGIFPDPEAGKIFLTGHTHIDTAWLWTLGETVRKTARTFATACRLMERFPEFRFSCSQAQLYDYMRIYYPALYEEIRAWVKTGRWECTGAMWVESDCNVPSGESLIRQLLYGVRFFEQEFGVHPRTCWLPDVFGYPASLPGILKGSGIENFMTSKLHWQARNPFPDHLFWWEGVDGSRLLAHIPDLRDNYNGLTDADSLTFAWEHFNQKGLYPEVLLPFGYGDGGGGVTEGMLESARRVSAFPGLPATRQGVEEDYFTEVRQVNPSLPVWVGELYLETHRGTYTTQAAVKKANRKNELLLREAELFGLAANLDLTPLRAAWRNLLLLQFHDILPGSSIGPVYQEASLDYAAIAQTAGTVKANALAALTQPADPTQLVVFNSLSWARSAALTTALPASLVGVSALEAVDANGRAVAAQLLAQGSGAMVFVPEEVPACGYTSYTLRPSANHVESSLHASVERMENRFYLLELTPEGEISRLYDKRAGREVIAAGQRANQLQLFQDGPEREAAWNVHATFAKRSYAWDAQTQISLLENGPVRACVRVEKTYRQSRLIQEIVLYDQLSRIDFITHCDWQERQVMLKAAFPVEVRTMSAACEIQYGVVERPTHRNTSWEQEKFEVCAHRWVDLSEGGYGVSLLNDCKYGYDVEGSTLRLTLLRGPEYPDPNADRGEHDFTYSLYPHLHDWRQGETVRAAASLNQPLVCQAGAAPLAGASSAQSFFTVTGPAILDTVKPAEDGRGWIARLYEANGGRGTVQLRSLRPLARVTTCNHIEEDQEMVETEANSFSFTIQPFQVCTFRLE
jgi:alpha-mannosidase